MLLIIFGVSLSFFIMPLTILILSAVNNFEDSQNLKIVIANMSIFVIGTMQLQKVGVTDCTGKLSHQTQF